MIEFETYDEIPEMLQGYLKTVAQVKEISMIPLPEINSFLRGIEECYGDDDDRLAG